MKKKLASWCIRGFGVCLGMFGGYGIVSAVESGLAGITSPGLMLVWTAALLLELFLLTCLQIAVHEAGHLLGGLASGYRFSSYRIGSLMLVRTEGGLAFRRLSIAGTGGQCLMVPPPMEDGRIPYVLYNLGGALANLILAACFGGLWLVWRENVWLAPAALTGAFIGLIFALTNGIPMRVGLIDNDGKNALSLGQNPGALRAFWVQMQINAAQTDGLRLRDMPDAWFAADGVDMHNPMTASLAVFACNRLMDEHRFAEADAQMKALLAGDNAVVGIYRSLLSCDCLWCALMNGDTARAAALDTPELRRFMRAMKSFPSVIRTAHARALFSGADAEAAACEAQFAKLTGRYPYPSDIACEGELMALAREKHHADCG